MNRHFLFRPLPLLLSCCALSGARSQSQSNVVYPVASCTGVGCPAVTTIPTHVTASFFDTINEVIYIGGKFNDLGGTPRPGLAAIDAVNSNLLSWAPTVNTGTVMAIAKSGDTVFVGGTFTQVNGQPRARIAAISASTGTLFNTFLTGTGNANDTVMSLLTLGNRLYAGGKFSTIASVARANIARLSYSGVADSWAASTLTAGPVRKLGWYGNKIVALTDVTADASSAIITIDISTSALVTRAQSDPTELITDFAMRGSTAFFTGPFFTINSLPRQTTAACDLATGIFTTWNPAPAIFSYDNRSRFSIACFRDSLYIGVFDVSSTNPAYHKLYVSHYFNGGLRVMKTYQSNLTGLNGYYNDDLLAGNSRLFEIERFAQHTAFPNGSVNCRFFSYCLRPPNFPGPFSGGPANACPGDTNVAYTIVPLAFYSSYSWSSTSTEISVTGTTNTGYADFSENFSGSANVRAYGITSCGISTLFPRNFTVTANALPAADAGQDDTLNCLTQQVILHGSSTTSGATFSWNGPPGPSAADSILANIPGAYILTVLAPNGCRKRDTALVAIDTVPPATVPFGTVPQLTCSDTLVLLDASSLYPGDSLYWAGPGLTANTNPAAVSQSANYLLLVTSRSNGCSAADTIYVAQNILPPPAVILAPDTVLTCIQQNVLLDASSTISSVTFQWADSSATLSANPVSVTVPGIYQLVATDTMNGCVNSANLVLITSWTSPPGIASLADSMNLNCSYATLPLNASSLTAGSAIDWTGPGNYSSPDPGMATQTGYYQVTATHPQNGCTSVDSIFIGYSAVLVVNAGNDTTICPGSGAVLQAFPVGGSPAFNFTWSNNAGNMSPVTVYPADTLLYVVTVTDSAGCSGMDSVIVNLPAPVEDSLLSFQPCDPLQPTGQLQAYAYGGVPPYQYSIDNGVSWNSTGVFTGLGYGSYTILIHDALGCLLGDTGIIDTNSLAPAPEFLVSTGPALGDTIVVVDISNPRPDSVAWDFPLFSTVTDSSMFAPAFLPGDTGAFALIMHAFYGTCEVVHTRWISVQPFDSLAATPWNQNGIDTIVLYPNPNSGTFFTDVTLFSKQDFVILVYDAAGNEHVHIPVQHSAAWSGQIILPAPVPGNYILRVVAEYDSEQVMFVITQ